MPAPDVQYGLDCALSCGHIGGDVHFYFMELCENTNEVYDGFRPDGDVPTMHGLRDHAQYLEKRFIEWRIDHPEAARLASLRSLFSIHDSLSEIANTVAGHAVELSIMKDTRQVWESVDKAYALISSMGAQARSMNRARHDLNGWSRQDLIRLEADAWAVTTKRLHEEGRLVTPDWRNGQSVGGTDKARTRAFLRQKAADERRRTIKRSIKLLTRIAGSETTRLFLSGEAIRIEGRHAIYEMRKMSDVTEAHGGFRALSVFSRDLPERLLCNICIGSKEVPLLDHIASLILHIQTGCEDEILRIGNARNVDDAAYDEPWLEPHLPRRVYPSADDLHHVLPFMMQEAPEVRAFRIKHRPRIAKRVLRKLYRDLVGDAAPLVRTAHAIHKQIEPRNRAYYQTLDYVFHPETVAMAIERDPEHVDRVELALATL